MGRAESRNARRQALADLGSRRQYKAWRSTIRTKFPLLDAANDPSDTELEGWQLRRYGLKRGMKAVLTHRNNSRSNFLSSSTLPKLTDLKLHAVSPRHELEKKTKVRDRRVTTR